MQYEYLKNRIIIIMDTQYITYTLFSRSVAGQVGLWIGSWTSNLTNAGLFPSVTDYTL